MLVNLIKSKKIFIWTLVFFMITFWIKSFSSIPKESNPATDLPLFIVNTIYYSWDPVTIENQITKKLEDEFKSISWVKKIESVSNFGFSTIIITFNDNKIINDAKTELKDSIDKIYNDFPANSIKPVVKQISPDDSPIYSFSVTWEYLTKILYEKSKNLEDEIKAIPWVSDVIITWKPDKKINIFLNYENINKYSLDINNITYLLSSVLVNQPTDKKDIWWNLYSYEISTYNKSIEDIVSRLENLDIINLNSQSIKLKNIANIYYEEVTYNEKSFLSKEDKMLNAISYNVKVSPWTDSQTVINEILKIQDKFKATNKDIEVYETYSRLIEINNTYETFISNFRQTWVIILIILFLFLWTRMALWVTIAFPLIYLSSFIYLLLAWDSFNNVVSFALVLSLWIIVDNLIVIAEWIVKEKKDNSNINYWDAVNKTHKKYISPVISWTATTIVMFLPILFMLSWVIWQFIWPLSIALTVTLISSLFISIIILPLFLDLIIWDKKDFSLGLLWDYLDKLGELFSKVTKIALKNKFTSFLVVIWFWLALFFWLFMVSIWIIKTDFLPMTDENNIWVNIKYPTWYSIEQNQEITQRILDDTNLFFENNYKNYVDFIDINIWNIYNTSPVTWSANSTATNQAYLNIKLIDWDFRDIKSYKIAEDLTWYINDTIKPKYNVLSDIYTVAWKSMSWWKAVWFYIIWDNINEISNYIDQIYPEIEKIPWAYNLSTNLEYTNWKVRYLIDLNKLSRNNTSISSIITLFASLKNSEYTPNWIKLKTFNELWEDSVDLVMFTEYKWDVENIKIKDNFLSQVTQERTLDSEFKNVQHIDWKLQIVIEADKNSNFALSDITTEIDKIIEKNKLPEWLSFRYNAAIEDQEQSMKDLWSAFWLWIILMFMILVYTYNSLKYSLIILVSNFLSLTWVLIALYFSWLPLSFPAQIWLFWVIWVWVNNAILFIEWFLNKPWIDKKEDLLNTVKSRFAPIFLTTSTTIAWLITLALKDELWWSLAIAFIWWLLLNVIMSLIYLPSLLNLIPTKKNLD